MTDKPIRFSGAMVRAILEGRKTQTRRVIPFEMTSGANPEFTGWRPERVGRHDWQLIGGMGIGATFRIPYAPGDRLWARESVVRAETDQGVGYQTYAACGGKVYPLTKWYHRRDYIPSIHMPRWTSRLTLTVTDVRVQRLQEISSFDCLQEGINADATILREISAADSDKHRRDEYHRAHVEPFRALWDSLNAKRGYGWEANPWVSATTFTVHRCNIDQME